jgi:hypothetical protein
VLVCLAAATAAILAGCGQSRLTADELASEERQLQSLAAETELFRKVLEAGHVTRVFAEGHAAYLRESVDEHVKKLETPAAPGLEPERARARRLGRDVQRLVGTLP